MLRNILVDKLYDSNNSIGYKYNNRGNKAQSIEINIIYGCRFLISNYCT
jgi:hypothetical protein